MPLSKFYLSLATLIFSPVAFSQFNFESPAELSIESGVGVVRGWVCNANKVQVRFDDKETLELPYGGDRPDTKTICNNNGKNGFGSVIFWPAHGEGQHTADLLVDDKIVTSVTFMVSGASKNFLKGVSANITVNDFPSEGSSKNLIWSQANQNFVFAQDPPKSSPTPAAQVYTRRLVSRRSELDGKLSQETSYYYLETGVNAGRLTPENAFKTIIYDRLQKVTSVRTGTVVYDKWGRVTEADLHIDSTEPYEDTIHTSKHAYASAPNGLLISTNSISKGYISLVKSRLEPKYDDNGLISVVRFTNSGIGQQTRENSDTPTAMEPSYFTRVATPTYDNGVVTSVSVSDNHKLSVSESRQWLHTYEVDYQDSKVTGLRRTSLNGKTERTWIASSDANHIVVHTQVEDGSMTVSTYTYEDGVCSLGPNYKNENDVFFIHVPRVKPPACR